MALNPKSFLYEHDRETGVATITLNRPEKLNALTFEVYEELRDAFYALDTADGVRAVVITGAGRAFCSGGDVEDIIGRLLGRSHQELLEFTRVTGALIYSIRKCRRPVIAALNGTVAGAGSVIAAACDIRVAAKSAKIAFLFTRVGLSGADMGASWLLPRIVGHGHASYMLMTGDFVDAAEAHRIGLYNQVMETGEEALNEARALAERLAKGPSFGLEISKESLDREWTMDLDTALAWETQVQAGCMLDPNFAESHAAFQDRREPRFD
jgi:enoyl-CoA hydratase/carnithine racemase